MFSLSSMNKVTWYSRLFSLVFIFGIFPTIVFFVGRRYQDTVTVIIKAEKAQSAALYNHVYFANSSGAPAAIIENRSILGEWINHQDGKYVMKVKDSNIYYEEYNGKLVSSGSWILRSNLPSDKVGSLPQGVYLQKITLNKEGVEDSLFYKVEFLDGSRMTLSFLENDAAISFSKLPKQVEKNNTATTTTNSIDPSN